LRYQVLCQLQLGCAGRLFVPEYGAQFRLVLEHDYTGSYKSVLRHVRAKFPKPKLRPFRRVETPPGAQAQVDWWECSGIDLGDGPQCQ
jgi:hypothetical protein